MGRRFVMGDIHGAYHALRQCLERSGFDKKNDHLICLGDVCDGWPETKQCIDTLLDIPNLTYIFGNHDYWTLEWMRSGYADEVWVTQGGAATMASYNDNVPVSHITFLENAQPYIIRDNKIFVHAGINPDIPLEKQNLNTFLWDRSLARAVMEHFTPDALTPYDEVYIGHTPVAFAHPIQSGGVWMMDTGAGWSGVLSMMDIDSKEVFTSDVVPSLYPGVPGRKKK